MDHIGAAASLLFAKRSIGEVLAFFVEENSNGDGRKKKRERDGLTPRYIRSIYFLDSLLSSCPSLTDAAAAVAAFSLHKSRHEGGTKKESLVRASRAREYAPRAQLYDEHSRETHVAGDHDDEPVCRGERAQRR